MGSSEFVPRIGSQCNIIGPGFLQHAEPTPELPAAPADHGWTTSPLATCRVIDLEPGQSLRFLWMTQNRRPATVTINLSPSGDGSLVEVAHQGGEGLRSWRYRRRVVEPFWRAVLRALRDFDVLLADEFTGEKT